MVGFEQACPPRLPYGNARTGQTYEQVYTGYCMGVLGPIKCTNICAQAAALALQHSILMNRYIQIENWH